MADDDQNEKNPAHELAYKVAADESLDRLPDLGQVMRATPAVRRLYFSEAIRSLGARRFYYDKQAESMVFEPDGATRMKAVAWLGGYDVGLPLQRIQQQIIQTGRAENLEDLLELLASTPAGLRAMERFTEKARNKKPGGQKPAELVDAKG